MMLAGPFTLRTDGNDAAQHTEHQRQADPVPVDPVQWVEWSYCLMCCCGGDGGVRLSLPAQESCDEAHQQNTQPLHYLPAGTNILALWGYF